MDIFDENRNSARPLADRMRSSDIENFIGQEHIVGQGRLLRRAILADRVGSCIFYGPPGTGKTTLAGIIANYTHSEYVYLNAVSSGVADAKKVIDDAKRRLEYSGKRTYLLLDECHRWNKAQSDCVLGAIEKGEIIFIGSTTENPYISMTKAIVSRCRIFEFKPLTKSEIKTGLCRALRDENNGLGSYLVDISDEALDYLSVSVNGDLRSALNALELAVLSTSSDKTGKVVITKEILSQSLQKPILSIDEGQYYDILSGFCKSIRGSDPDAALYYALRLIASGCDPLIIFRRLIVHAAEDVGLADPNALNIAVSAMTAFEKIGLPEGKIPMAEAIIYVCKAPKSDRAIKALQQAEEKALLGGYDVPFHLRDTNYKTEKIFGYKYPHDYGGYVKQQYLPEEIKDEKFYIPTNNGEEKLYHGIWRGKGEYNND